jgi:hypothetical protein
MPSTDRRRGGCAWVRWTIVSVGVALSAVTALLPAGSTSGSAPFPGAVNIVPKATPGVGNCIPFGNNVDFGFAGFIYRNVPAFTLKAGMRIAFDLGGTNDVDVRRDIYVSPADHNPGPGAANVRATTWTKLVSDSQTPENARGNTVVGDYELVYRVERGFVFNGGGLVVGFAASPPSAVADGGCQQVGVYTDINDPSGMFYARFWSRPHLYTGILDTATWSRGFVAGLVLFIDTDPPVVSATVSPTPGSDGWIDPADGPALVSWSGTDEGSGVASCDEPVTLSAPGIYELSGTCTDVAGNVGTATVTVRVARRIVVDVSPGNPISPFSVKRKGVGAFLVSSDPGLNVSSMDPASMRFGVRGDEESIRSCSPSGADLLCRFDVETSGLADQLVFKAFADGVRVIGSDTVRLVG